MNFDEEPFDKEHFEKFLAQVKEDIRHERPEGYTPSMQTSPPFEIAHGDPSFPFYWLSTAALNYTMKKMNESADEFLENSKEHLLTHTHCPCCECGDCGGEEGTCIGCEHYGCCGDDCKGFAPCDDCDEGIFTPHIQATYKTIVRMCGELERRYVCGDIHAKTYNDYMALATLRWKPYLDPPFEFNVVMELEGVPLEPLP